MEGLDFSTVSWCIRISGPKGYWHILLFRENSTLYFGYVPFRNWSCLWFVLTALEVADPADETVRDVGAAEREVSPGALDIVRLVFADWSERLVVSDWSVLEVTPVMLVLLFLLFTKEIVIFKRTTESTPFLNVSSRILYLDDFLL